MAVPSMRHQAIAQASKVGIALTKTPALLIAESAATKTKIACSGIMAPSNKYTTKRNDSFLVPFRLGPYTVTTPTP